MGTKKSAGRRRPRNRTQTRKKRLDTWKVAQTLLAAVRIVLWFVHNG